MGQSNPTSGQPWLLPASGAAARDAVADVAVARRARGLVTVAVPARLRKLVGLGAMVRFPLGTRGRMADGWVLRISEAEWDHTRPQIAEVLDARQLLTPGLVELALWVSGYYAASPGRTISTILPAVVRQRPQRTALRVRWTGRMPGASLPRKQQRLFDAIREGDATRGDLLKRVGASPAVLKRLVEAGLADVYRAPVVATVAAPGFSPAESSGAALPPIAPGSPEDAFVLSEAQQAALHSIEGDLSRGDFRVTLLYGVPGSGKTEVYVRAMRAAVAGGRQAILLVPEIALTTQVVQRLARRFARVAVLHGHLTPGQRRETFASIARGDADVVIGTRTAVFAPCPRLGLIVVDEEQESSYKNLASPFYHARDVAIKRGQLEKAAVLLGSATPSLESWFNATHAAHFRLARLDSRVGGATPPRVRCVQRAQRLEAAAGPSTEEPPLLAAELVAALRETLAAGGQAILLHNRRGYAMYLRCGRCGLMVRCARCAAPLVLHRAKQEATMRCHHCGATTPAPTRCLDDTCNGPLLRSRAGVQRLEEELARWLPSARLSRLDSDSMRTREAYEAALGAFERGDADVLLGTQMIAKGLDFPRVRLVGVVEADAGLGLPDFRAAERTFQLITQVIGRAGRRNGDSLAIVQCAERAPPVIEAALRMDYEAMAALELPLRRSLGYPPYGRMTRLVFADADARRARGAARSAAESLRRLAGRVHAGVTVCDAEPCVMQRVRGRWRWQVLVLGPRDAGMQQLLRAAESGRLLRGGVQRMVIDVDPIEML